MIRTLTVLSVMALGLCACKPTERTALKKKQQKVAAEAPAETPAAPEQIEVAAAEPAEPAPLPQPPPAEPAPLPELPAAEVAAAPEQPAPAAEVQPAEPAHGIMVVRATLQEYNQLQPWEKETPRQARALGVFMGEGRVLTVGRAVRAATYVELMLPDDSRSVPARVLRYDEDTNLALLTVLHEEDAGIFDTRTALPLGEALNRGDVATHASLINGVEPVHVALRAEDAGGDTVPLMVMRAERPLNEGLVGGSPVVRDGKLSALCMTYKKADLQLSVVNAEIIQRFLTQESPGVPVVGVQLSPLDDPVFRQYLKLDASATGLYISKVVPGSAAAEAGVQVGDVLTAVDGMPVDNQGRCNHPRYGLHGAAVLLRGIKDRGQELLLTISRGGETLEVMVKMNRAAVENALCKPEVPGSQPRYIMWGGMLFQPLSSTLLENLAGRNNGVLPLHLQELANREEELRNKGYTELIGLTFVLPTAATQGYDELRFSQLLAVNGQQVNSFAELAALLDAPTENGLIRLDFNKPPYTVYLDRATVDAVNTQLQSTAIPNLRVVE